MCSWTCVWATFILTSRGPLPSVMLLVGWVALPEQQPLLHAMLVAWNAVGLVLVLCLVLVEVVAGVLCPAQPGPEAKTTEQHIRPPHMRTVAPENLPDCP